MRGVECDCNMLSIKDITEKSTEEQKPYKKGLKAIIIKCTGKTYYNTAKQESKVLYHMPLADTNGFIKATCYNEDFLTLTKENNGILMWNFMEDDVKNIFIGGHETELKSMTIKDDTYYIKITLWREETQFPIKIGDYIKITHVTIHEFNEDKLIKYNKGQHTSDLSLAAQETQLIPEYLSVLPAPLSIPSISEDSNGIEAGSEKESENESEVESDLFYSGSQCNSAKANEEEELLAILGLAWLPLTESSEVYPEDISETLTIMRCSGREIPRLRRQAITLGVMIAVNVFINIVLYRLVERAVFYSPRVQSCAGLPDEAGDGPGSSQNPLRSLQKTSLCLQPVSPSSVPVSQYNPPDRQGRLPGQSCPRVRNEPGTEDSSPWREFQPHLRETLCLHRALVTLDPDTAHERLILSEDGRRVSWTDRPQSRPDNPKRIIDNYYPAVLGREGFTTGRHYWEVQVVQEGREWGYVGVAGESLRGGFIGGPPVSPVWGLTRSGSGLYRALSFSLSSPRSLHLKIGVYLDYEGGRLSFYNADRTKTLKLFHTANGTFTGGLHPFFMVRPGADLSLL
ncbi:uncharacterized protein LOC144770013 [Lissotriton helveticus]